MSRGDYYHLHRDTAPNTVVVHSPDGVVRGYIVRVRVEGQSRPVFDALDEKRESLSRSYLETRERALEWVAER